MKAIKFLIILLLIIGVFGGAGYFIYDLYLKPKQALIAEKAQPSAEPTPAPTPVDPSLPEVEKAMEMLKENQQEEARSLLEKIIIAYPESTRIDEVKQVLGNLNIDRLFSQTITPEKIAYTVVSGDSLVKIASHFGSSAELIMRANNMESTMLQIGMQLVIPKVDLTMQIDSQKKVITLWQGNQFFKEYKPLVFKITGTAPTAPVALRITEKFAWYQGKRVAFGSKEYMGSTRWIQVSRPGLTIYGQDEQPQTNPPATGIALSPADMEELHTLANHNMAVELR